MAATASSAVSVATAALHRELFQSSIVSTTASFAPIRLPQRIAQAGAIRQSVTRCSATNEAVAAETKAAPAAVEEEEEEEEPPSFLADVASLVKMVDSSDIVELELKDANYEIVIRKQAALADAPAAPAAAPPPSFAPYQTFPGPHVMAHTQFAQQTMPAPAAPADAPAAAPAAPVAPPAPKLPPMLSPMAGTFYLSPAPNEPSFVKVGDRVSKGQVVCIIEAMKLMNEIEADQSGEIIDIIADDGKTVAIESPLFIIRP